ncbi:MAG: hypothetical protein OD918_06735 [Gammaproteobacteria bacterium]
MIDPDKPVREDVLQSIREYVASDSIVRLWQGKTYGEIQNLTNPKKGEFGEVLTERWFRACGYKCKRSEKKKRGGKNFDLTITLPNEKSIQAEVKFATMDSKGRYQINWISLHYAYQLLVLVAMSPEAMFLGTKSSAEIKDMVENPQPGRVLTLVPPKNPSHRKWTVTPDAVGLVEISTYGDVKGVLDAGVRAWK